MIFIFRYLQKLIINFSVRRIPFFSRNLYIAYWRVYNIWYCVCVCVNPINVHVTYALAGTHVRTHVCFESVTLLLGVPGGILFAHAQSQLSCAHWYAWRRDISYMPTLCINQICAFLTHVRLENSNIRCGSWTNSCLTGLDWLRSGFRFKLCNKALLSFEYPGYKYKYMESY